VIEPGLALASSMNSFAVFQRLLERTTSTVGSAVNRATGTRSLSWYIGARSSTRSASGRMVIDDSAISSV
jgi:hypothetical protein